jgi:Gram-negative bacterial TonB protein C-terminal
MTGGPCEGRQKEVQILSIRRLAASSTARLAFCCSLTILAGDPRGALARRSATPTAKQESASYAEIDALLRRGDWDRAWKELNQIADISFSVKKLARVAVAEAGLGMQEDALWHWLEAQNLDRRFCASFAAEEMTLFGEPGQLLAQHRLRKLGETPAGHIVARPGERGSVPPRPVASEPSILDGIGTPPRWARLEIVVDAYGRALEPVIEAASERFVAFNLLEQVRHLRYEPARQDGRPVAMFHAIVVHSLAPAPLASLVKLAPEAAAADELLRTRHWQDADTKLAHLWEGALDGGADSTTLGALFAERALAAAGLGRSDLAICRWHAAQSFAAQLYHLDLAPYGPAVADLGRKRWGELRARGAFLPSDYESIHEPRIVAAPSALYPEAARRGKQSEAVVAMVVIDERGLVREPEVIRGGLAPGFPITLTASSLETACSWRFQPATMNEEPVPVLYELTIPFRVK